MYDINLITGPAEYTADGSVRLLDLKVHDNMFDKYKCYHILNKNATN